MRHKTKVTVILKYSSKEPGGFESTKYELKKDFYFQHLPVVNSHIILEDDAREFIHFKNPLFNPNIGEYTVYNEFHEGVERYYHGDAEEIMGKVLGRYKQHGWAWNYCE